MENSLSSSQHDVNIFNFSSIKKIMNENILAECEVHSHDLWVVTVNLPSEILLKIFDDGSKEDTVECTAVWHLPIEFWAWKKQETSINWLPVDLT